MKSEMLYQDNKKDWIDQRDPELISRLIPIWEWFYKFYFRVNSDGWQNVPQQGQILFVGSHNGGLATPDLPMFMLDWFRRFGLERKVYGLTHSKVWQAYPAMANLAARVGAVPFYARNAQRVIDRGHSLLVYPGGGQDAFRPHHLRGKIHFCERTGFIRIAVWHGLPVVPLISWGSHDTLYIIDDCYPMAKTFHQRGVPWLFNLDPEVMPLYAGLPWGLAIGPLPNIPFPSKIYTRVCKPIKFPKYGYEASRDKYYIRQCYHHVVESMQSSLNSLRKEVNG